MNSLVQALRSAVMAALRSAVMAALPEGAFLRRDRGEALFVTDAPRRDANIDWGEIGFLCREADGLAHLTPDARWLVQLEAQYPEPPNALCASLQRFSGTPDAESLALFSRAVKLLETGEDDPTYEKALRQRAAVCLREGHRGGGLYACALAHYLYQSENEEKE